LISFVATSRIERTSTMIISIISVVSGTRVGLEASEKHFDALEDVDKSVLTCSNILSCLRDAGVTMARTELLKRLHTERRTPTPAKITLAGGNTCHMNVRVQITVNLTF
jgi:hypothetical protein